MKLTRSASCLLLWILLISGSSPGGSEQQQEDLKAHFGFSINPTANSGLITYAIVETDQDNKIVGRTIVTRNNWILQMKGEQRSKANVEGIDLWSKYEIGDCFWMLDPKIDKYIAQKCETKISIDDLWRLRYNRNPEYRQDKITSDLSIVGGWAANAFRPNWPQVQILQNYGIIFISDFFFGEGMFQLLKDLQDPSWLETYKTAG